MHAIAERNFNVIEAELINHGLDKEHTQILKNNWAEYGSTLA